MSDKIEPALLPCPFCGCEVQEIRGFDYVRVYGTHGINCPFLGDDPLIAEAKEWNTRSDQSAPVITHMGGYDFVDATSQPAPSSLLEALRGLLAHCNTLDAPESEAERIARAAIEAAVDMSFFGDSPKDVLMEIFFQQGDEPFICAIRGRICLEQIELAQKDFRDNLPDELERHGDGTYIFNFFYESGQYDDMGRCEIAGGWGFDFISHAAFEAESVDPECGDEIPDFTPGNGNKARKRAEALGLTIDKPF